MLSKALFLHLAKMKYAGWRHRVDFKRHRKHSMADFFQDLVAFHLRCALPDTEFRVHLEHPLPLEGGRQIHPDILIERKNSDGTWARHFVIEVKTTIGWARPDATAHDKYEELKNRLDAVARAARIDVRNVIYIFEEPSNVSADFHGFYWDKKRSQAKDRGELESPL